MGTQFLNRKLRELRTSWKFLIEDIPRSGVRIFTAGYSLFCLLATLVIAEAGRPNQVDHAIAKWVHSRSVLRGKWSQRVTRFGDGNWIRKGCVAGVAVLFLLKRWNYVPVLLIGVLGEMAGNRWLQNTFGRGRPEFPDVPPIPAFAFPSGHAGAAAAFLGFWFLFLFLEHRRSALARIAMAALGLCVVAVGLSRVFILAHWLTDILGAYAFATAWLLLSAWVNERMQALRPYTDCRHDTRRQT